MTASERRLVTVGHSNRPIEGLLQRLDKVAVTVVADIRTTPGSRWSPQYNTAPLRASLAASGIGYVWLPELGGRPPEPALFDAAGHVRYDALSLHPRFLAGLARLRTGMATFRVAVLCSEEDPRDCHRRLLVGRVLTEEGVILEHLRGNGRLEVETSVPLPTGAWRSRRPLRRT